MKNSGRYKLSWHWLHPLHKIIVLLLFFSQFPIAFQSSLSLSLSLSLFLSFKTTTKIEAIFCSVQRISKTVCSAGSQTVRAMVVVQLVEWLLPIPEVCGSNPDIGNILYWIFTVNCIEKTKIKEKWPRMAHLKKTVFLLLGTYKGSIISSKNTIPNLWDTVSIMKPWKAMSTTKDTYLAIELFSGRRWTTRLAQ